MVFFNVEKAELQISNLSSMVDFYFKTKWIYCQIDKLFNKLINFEDFNLFSVMLGHNIDFQMVNSYKRVSRVQNTEYFLSYFCVYSSSLSPVKLMIDSHLMLLVNIKMMCISH